MRISAGVQTWALPISLYDLLEVRALLESESARLAALRGTDADFVLLRRRYEEMLAAHASEQGADPREHARLDHAFHLAICEASHNPVLVHTQIGRASWRERVCQYV